MLIYCSKETFIIIIIIIVENSFATLYFVDYIFSPQKNIILKTELINYKCLYFNVYNFVLLIVQ